MRTIDSIVNELTNSQKLIEDLTEMLRIVDSGFPAQEAGFQASRTGFLEEVGNRITPSAQEYLDALELDYASSVIYMAGQGFQLNLETFRNPSASLFLVQGDFEDITRERMLGMVPGVQKAWDIIHAFRTAVRQLPEADAEKIHAVSEGICEWYAYLQTVGYKLAHYYGFVLANRLLPYVLPGYHADEVITFRYRGRLENYLELNLVKLDLHRLGFN